MKVRSVGTLGVLLLVACHGGPLPSNEPAKFTHSGWLIKKASTDTSSQCAAVGDGAHAWLWHPEKKDLGHRWRWTARERRRAGRTRPEARLGSSLGDGHHGLILTETRSDSESGTKPRPAEAHVIGLVPQETRSIALPLSLRGRHRWFAQPEGTWAWGADYQHDASAVAFLPARSENIEGPWPVPGLLDGAERMIAGRLVLAGLGEGEHGLQVVVVDHRTGPLRVVDTTEPTPKNHDWMTAIEPTPDKAKCWIRSSLNAVYVVDPQLAVERSLAKEAYAPTRIEVQEQFTIRPLSGSRALAYVTHADHAPVMQIDADTHTIQPFSPLAGWEVSNLIVLDETHVLAQTTVSGTSCHLIYVDDRTSKDLGDCKRFEVSLSPKKFMVGDDILVFPNRTRSAFIIRTPTTSFRLSPGADPAIAVVAGHDEEDVNRYVAPTLIPDGDQLL